MISLLQHLGIFKKKDLSTNSLSFFFLNGVHLGCDQACFCLLCCPIWPGWLAIDWQPLNNMPIDNHFSSPLMIKCLLITRDQRFHFYCYPCFPNEDGRFSNNYFPSCSQQNFRKRFMTMWTLDRDHQPVFATSVQWWWCHQTWRESSGVIRSLPSLLISPIQAEFGHIGRQMALTLSATNWANNYLVQYLRLGTSDTLSW